EAGGEEFKRAELDSSPVQRFEDRANRLGTGGVRKCDHGKLVVIDGLNPRLANVIQRIIQSIVLLVINATLLALHYRLGPLGVAAISSTQNAERQDQLIGLGLERFQHLRALVIRAQVEDRLLEFRAVHQLAQV